MPFIGKQPKVGAYQLIDSITTSATATYALTVDGSAYFPESARNLIVSLNGVTQAPESAYTVSGSNIVFDSALTTSDVIDYILVIGDAVDIGTPSDGTVGTSQMSYPLGNFSSTGIDDNATSTAITIDSSENVGIGITSPAEKVHIQGASAGSGAGEVALRLDVPADSVSARNEIRSGVTGGTNPYMAFTVRETASPYATVERMRIDSSGNVGIGLTPRTDPKLAISGQFDLGGSNRFYYIRENSSADALEIGARISSDTVDANYVHMTAGGNVGIGTNSPDSKLDVRGIVLGGAGSPSTGQIAFGVQYGGSTNIANTFGTMKSSAATCIGWGVYGSPSVNEGFVSSVDTSLNFRRGALLVDQDELRFLNAAQQTVARDAAVTMTERLKVDASGRLMLNIAASSIQAPLRAQAFGTTSSYFGYYFDAAGTVLSYVRADGLFSTGNGSLSPYSFSTTGRDVYVNSSGQLGYVSSIREAKENIQPIEDVSWLYSLSPVSFNYKEKDDEGQFTREVNEEVEYGLIADEVEQVNANLCFYDENEEGDKTLAGVSYRKLIPVLTKAIQEQQAIIEDLQTRLSALEAN